MPHPHDSVRHGWRRSGILIVFDNAAVDLLPYLHNFNNPAALDKDTAVECSEDVASKLFFEHRIHIKLAVWQPGLPRR